MFYKLLNIEMVQFVNISHGTNNLIHSQGVFLEKLNYNIEKKGFINMFNLIAVNVRKNDTFFPLLQLIQIILTIS
jgi:hypothetical protein